MSKYAEENLDANIAGNWKYPDTKGLGEIIGKKIRILKVEFEGSDEKPLDFVHTVDENDKVVIFHTFSTIVHPQLLKIEFKLNTLVVCKVETAGRGYKLVQV